MRLHLFFYQSEQLTALENATDERIEAGLLALGFNTKSEAQKAYYNFIKAKKLSPDRRDVDSLIDESLAEGTVRIVVEGDYKYDKSYVKDIERGLFRSLPISKEAKPFYQFYNPEEATENRLNPDFEQFSILENTAVYQRSACFSFDCFVIPHTFVKTCVDSLFKSCMKLM